MDLEAARRTRIGDHVPRPAAALLHNVRAAVRRRLRPRRPHHRAAPAGAPPVRSGRACRPTASTTARSTSRSSRNRPITLTERGDTVTENALLAAALSPGVTVLRNASPNYMVQDLCVFLTPLGVEDRRHRHHHPAGASACEQHQHRRRVRAVGGPDRGDEPAHRGDRHPVGADHPAGADRVLGDRAGDPGGDGPGVLPQRGVPGRQRAHPAGRPHRPAVAARARRSTRSTRCRSPG